MGLPLGTFGVASQVPLMSAVDSFSDMAFPRDPSPTSSLWYPRHAHALICPLSTREVRRMVASAIGAKQADREDRIKRKARLCCSACLVKLTKVSQCSGEKKVCERVVSVSLNGPPIPSDRFSIEAAPQLGGAYI